MQVGQHLYFYGYKVDTFSGSFLPDDFFGTPHLFQHLHHSSCLCLTFHSPVSDPLEYFSRIVKTLQKDFHALKIFSRILLDFITLGFFNDWIKTFWDAYRWVGVYKCVGIMINWNMISCALGVNKNLLTQLSCGAGLWSVSRLGSRGQILGLFGHLW